MPSFELHHVCSTLLGTFSKKHGQAQMHKPAIHIRFSECVYMDAGEHQQSTRLDFLHVQSLSFDTGISNGHSPVWHIRLHIRLFSSTQSHSIQQSKSHPSCSGSSSHLECLPPIMANFSAVQGSSLAVGDIHSVLSRPSVVCTWRVP